LVEGANARTMGSPADPNGTVVAVGADVGLGFKVAVGATLVAVPLVGVGTGVFAEPQALSSMTAATRMDTNRVVFLIYSSPLVE
jgi:hypothetical protein